jgi:hypothetical protein
MLGFDLAILLFIGLGGFVGEHYALMKPGKILLNNFRSNRIVKKCN